MKVLAGGPMMGISMRSLDVPVVKGTSGILALSSEISRLLGKKVSLDNKIEENMISDIKIMVDSRMIIEDRKSVV